jgi:hypothetical protein
MSTKDVGNKLEELVVTYIKKIDTKARRTKNSGGSVELEDILSEYFMVQCKVDNSHENLIIKKQDLKKLQNALPINSKRIPIFVTHPKNGTPMITLFIDDYFRTVYRAYDTSGEIQ